MSTHGTIRDADELDANTDRGESGARSGAADAASGTDSDPDRPTTGGLTFPSALEDTSDIDGRSLRRLRNREKVIDAYLELVATGNRSPSIDDLAKYSGVSFRSIYRYFASTAELVAAAAERGLAMFHDDLAVPAEGEGPLDERIERLVDQRLDLYRRAAPFVTAARTTHFDDEHVAALFARLRQILAAQIGRHFAPELTSLPADERQDTIAGIYLGFLNDSISMLDDLYVDRPDRVRAIMIDHVRRHLA